MNDLKFAFRQLQKNPGFTVHPPQCRRSHRVQFRKSCCRKPGPIRQYCYAGRTVPRLRREFIIFNMKRVTWSILVVSIVLSSSPRAEENGGEMWWPQFRGPNSSGLGAGKPPVHFGPGQNVLWKTALGSGLSSPIVWAERVFLTEFDQTSQKLAALCIDRRAGKVLWRRMVAAEEIEKVHELSSPAGATPATDGERVYVHFGSYGLVCYDLDGNQKWERTESHLYAFGN